jgi:DNA (cytosine-5)-methyltransferase 1
MIRIADLFAGIGGIRLGFEQAFGKENIDCVFTSEIDKFAVETYKTNFDDKNIFGDITKIDPWEIPDHDILLAGFPCQPFSCAGKREGFDDSRGGAYFVIERILMAKRPKVFLLENVKRLQFADNGEVFRMIISRLAAIGYKVFYKVLAAKDFGVPQNRERIFIVGCLGHAIDFQFPEPLNIPTKLGDILEEKVDSKYTLSDRAWDYEKNRLTKCINCGKRGSYFSYKIENENSLFTRTLTAHYGGGDKKNILIEQSDKNPRKLMPRECARLQGFPDSFVINKVSESQIYKQLGNSVCVPVIKAVAEQIRKIFFEMKSLS